jgi:hypothetical protein
VPAGQKPTLASHTVIPPFRLYSQSVLAVVQVAGPFPVTGVPGPRVMLTSETKFSHTAGAAVGTLNKEHLLSPW